jgi:hypothetical protein
MGWLIENINQDKCLKRFGINLKTPRIYRRFLNLLKNTTTWLLQQV